MSKVRRLPSSKFVEIGKSSEIWIELKVNGQLQRASCKSKEPHIHNRDHFVTLD